MKVHFVSLGCPKNLTDTEVIMGLLASAGWKITDTAKEADLIIINTCAFIKSAQEESIQETLRLAKFKKSGNCKYLVMVGCLPQRHAHHINELLPEVDAFVGSSDIYKINKIIEKLFINHKSGAIFVSPHGACLFDENTPRIKATPAYSAYVKISEGCNNNCSYCAVPLIRGKLKSRTIDSIINEVKNLAKNGLKEIIYVGQDTTSYGKDLKIKDGLVKLLKKTLPIKGINWIRIMYAHPKHLSPELIKIMAKEPKICKYLDLPIQHIYDKILRRMKRPYSAKYIEKLIHKIRREIPGISIRTSLIVGFPGETERDFTVLKDFIKRVKFDKLGVFAYSQEEGTPANKLGGQVLEKTKQKRVKEIYEIQRQVSKEQNKSMIGNIIEILIEGKKGPAFIGRSFREAPEIDGSIQVQGKNLRPGKIVKARIISAGSYNLKAALVT